MRRLAVEKPTPAAAPPALAPLRGGRKRERDVIEAALKVFHEKGYSQATMQDIADSLGMLKGSIYHYIDSKEDLLFRVLELVHDDVDVILEEVAARDDLPPWEQLRIYVRRMVEYDARNLAHISVYYNDLDRLSEGRYAQIMARRRAHEQFVSSVIRRAKADDGETSEETAILMTNFAFGALVWTYRWYRPDGPISIEMLASACADFVIHGAAGQQRQE